MPGKAGATAYFPLGRLYPLGRPTFGTPPSRRHGHAHARSARRLPCVRGMASEPEVSIITGKITEVGGRFVWIWPGTRVALLPNIDMAELTPGTRITVRAVRRHGQFVAESITVEQPSSA